MKITTSMFKSIRNAFPSTAVSTSIPDFLDSWREVSHQPLADKSKAEAFSLCRYKEGMERKKEHIQSVSSVILDIDHPVTTTEVDALIQRMEKKASITYSTYSSTPEQYKCRIILPLADPVSVEVFETEDLPIRAAKLLGTPPIDSACCSAAQIYYVPSCKPGTEEDHFLHVSKAEEPWALNDFPALEEGDRDRFVDKRSKSTLMSKHNASLPERKEKPSKKEIYLKLDALVTKHFGGTPPIYTEHCFNFYHEGRWCPVDTKTLIRELMVEVYDEEVGLDVITVIIEYMKTRYYQERFPEPAIAADGQVRLLICLTNGTLDPLAGEMVPNASENYLRTQMAYAFEPAATCKRWLSFLDEIFAPDTDKEQKILQLQEFMGYLLIPSTRFQAMLWLYGQGANGKSVINEVISLLLGVENISTIPLDRLSKRFQAAELLGKLANLTDEIGADGALRDDILKQVVAGSQIQGERKNKDPFTFRPFARIVVAMNHFPRTKDSSHGFFRRIQLLVLNRIFATDEQDRDLILKLKAELPGIFVWALEGLQRLWAQGEFTVVPSSVAALNQYREECNPVALFVRDLVIQTDKLVDVKSNGRSAKHLVHDVYRVYQSYCRAKGFMPLADSRFGREMSSLGIVAVKSSGKRYYNVKLRKPEDVGILGMDAPLVTQFTQVENEDELVA